MTRDQQLLVLLMEECDELSQRASKAIRFSLTEVQPEQDLNNAERIVYEFNDLIAVMELLHLEGYLPHLMDRPAIELKKKKIESYMEYSKQINSF